MTTSSKSERRFRLELSSPKKTAKQSIQVTLKWHPVGERCHHHCSSSGIGHPSLQPGRLGINPSHQVFSEFVSPHSCFRTDHKTRSKSSVQPSNCNKTHITSTDIVSFYQVSSWLRSQEQLKLSVPKTQSQNTRHHESYLGAGSLDEVNSPKVGSNCLKAITSKLPPTLRLVPPETRPFWGSDPVQVSGSVSGEA